MLAVPTHLTRADIAFGNIDHMPKFDTLPKDFQNLSDPHCRAVSKWFYSGASKHPGGIKIDGVGYKAREGVDPNQALAAIKSVLGSFEPKHEHKIAGCGYMLSQWFERDAS